MTRVFATVFLHTRIYNILQDKMVLNSIHLMYILRLKFIKVPSDISKEVL
jgi:hypothetical protein